MTEIKTTNEKIAPLEGELSTYLDKVNELKISNGETDAPNSFYFAVLTINLAELKFQHISGDTMVKASQDLLKQFHTDKANHLGADAELNERLTQISQAILEARAFLKDDVQRNNYLEMLKKKHQTSISISEMAEGRTEREKYQTLNTLAIEVGKAVKEKWRALFKLPNGNPNRSHPNYSNETMSSLVSLTDLIATTPRGMHSAHLVETSVVIDLSNYQPDVQSAFADTINDRGKGSISSAQNDRGQLTVNYTVSNLS